MKHIVSLVLIILFFSCGKKKVIHLPEIQQAHISDIKDVSPAYIFYDETLPDSTELNRKNLISTTNWLVNVDKRLSLKQAIPHIVFLQNKKQNAGHQKKGVKNYFTCNDVSKKNLGFIDFTNVIYHEQPTSLQVSKTSKNQIKSRFNITFHSATNIEITGFIDGLILKKTDKNNVVEDLSRLVNQEKKQSEIVLNFNANTTFQDYITYKSVLQNLKTISIVQDEFIFN